MLAKPFKIILCWLLSMVVYATNVTIPQLVKQGDDITQAYLRHNSDAYRMSLHWYFLGYEAGGIEGQLALSHPKRNQNIEHAFRTWSIALSHANQPRAVIDSWRHLKYLLQHAEDGVHTMSVGLQSFLILFREGGEIILLVIGAWLSARRCQTKTMYVYGGLLIGIISSMITAYGVVYHGWLPSSFDHMLAMAAGFLMIILGVGLWGCHKRNTQRPITMPWLWCGALGVTLYREGTEILLFYRALWYTNKKFYPLLLGALLALLVLSTLVSFVRWHRVRLPLTMLFRITSVAMIGAGIHWLMVL
jgi:high-affinity Fe2+/Pb2+ permease